MKQVNLYLKVVLVAFFGCWILQSCQEIVNTAGNWATTTEEITDVDGKYIPLNNGMKIFLPKTFEQKTISQYSKLLDSVVGLEESRIKVANLRALEKSSNEFYLFFDPETKATCFLNTMEYLPFKRQDARYILAFIKKDLHDNLSSDLSYEKITATYNATADADVFRSIFRMSNPLQQRESYLTTYILSSREGKSLRLMLTTPFQVDFDPFLRKIRL